MDGFHASPPGGWLARRPGSELTTIHEGGRAITPGPPGPARLLPHEPLPYARMPADHGCRWPPATAAAASEPRRVLQTGLRAGTAAKPMAPAISSGVEDVPQADGNTPDGRCSSMPSRRLEKFSPLPFADRQPADALRRVGWGWCWWRHRGPNCTPDGSSRLPPCICRHVADLPSIPVETRTRGPAISQCLPQGGVGKTTFAFTSRQLRSAHRASRWRLSLGDLPEPLRFHRRLPIPTMPSRIARWRDPSGTTFAPPGMAEMIDTPTKGRRRAGLRRDRGRHVALNDHNLVLLAWEA